MKSVHFFTHPENHHFGNYFFGTFSKPILNRNISKRGRGDSKFSWVVDVPEKKEGTDGKNA